MSQRRKTVPPNRVTSRSSHSGRSELIARENNEKRSAKKRSALDDRFHRTYFAFSCEQPHEPAAEWHGGCGRLSSNAICSRRYAVNLELDEALQRPGHRQPLVSCTLS
jgi:hypothetical protein